ncbi:activator of basal transcription 1-like [Portunus trituberculatus]|uniref:activator of basal transcription 1-like n=1 Tax=Portunus trituberculatus TaxID=210409 RepID=UPI001E1CB7C7|nr:activator of basal transcription 1-like [Portunus trituberculatus]
MEDAAPLLSENGGEDEERRPKRRKPGIVYLSSIPPNMNVAKIRQYFTNFGELDRVFLQAVDKDDKNKGSSKGKKFKKSLHFTEGWVEFKSKRKAKQVHVCLNNQPVGGKKKNNPYYDMLWNIKYLPRFKWAYLKQRLEYEREMTRQRMGAEISQVRKETDHFLKLSEISKKKKKRKEAAKEGKEEVASADNAESKDKVFVFKQKDTEEEKLSKKEERKRKNEMFRKRIADKKKKKQKKKVEKPVDFLGSVFVGHLATPLLAVLSSVCICMCV